MKVKTAWMDSMSFDHELGRSPENHIFATQADCEKYHEYIQDCRKEPDRDPDLNCFAQEVVVIHKEDVVIRKENWESLKSYYLIP